MAVAVTAALISKVYNFFSSSKLLAFRFRMARKMKQINTRLDKIAVDRQKFGLQIIDADNRVVHRRETTHSSVIDSKVIGREHDKEKIIKLLIQRGNDKNLCYPHCWAWGCGKDHTCKASIQ